MTQLRKLSVNQILAQENAVQQTTGLCEVCGTIGHLYPCVLHFLSPYFSWVMLKVQIMGMHTTKSGRLNHQIIHETTTNNSSFNNISSKIHMPVT